MRYRLAMVRQNLGIDLFKLNSIRQQGGSTHHPQPKNSNGLKSMSGPDASGDPSKGQQKGKRDAAGDSHSGRGTTKPDVPINAANVVHKTECKHWLTEKGCQYADRCQFVNTVLDYKDGRCFNCYGKGRSRRECPWEKGVSHGTREVRQKTQR